MARDQEERDREIEREIRSHRRFSLSEAMGRSGGGLMKGASPVARLHQVRLECDDLLEKHLQDGEGALTIVLHRRIASADLILFEYLDDSKGGLHALLGSILKNETTLRDFVRDVDAEWGRLYAERPKFDFPGRPPAHDDPYTVDEVRRSLEDLRSKLEE